MDVLKMLTELRVEREQIQGAIMTLERLAAGSAGRRRGRPPKWMSAIKLTTISDGQTRKKRIVIASPRKRILEVQRKGWAAKRAKAGLSD